VRRAEVVRVNVPIAKYDGNTATETMLEMIKHIFQLGHDVSSHHHRHYLLYYVLSIVSIVREALWNEDTNQA